MILIITGISVVFVWLYNTTVHRSTQSIQMSVGDGKRNYNVSLQWNQTEKVNAIDMKKRVRWAHYIHEKYNWRVMVEGSKQSKKKEKYERGMDE